MKVKALMETKEDQILDDTLSPTIREFLAAGVFSSIEEARLYQASLHADQQAVHYPKQPERLVISHPANPVDYLSQKLGIEVSQAQAHMTTIDASLRQFPPTQHLILFLILNKISVQDAMAMQPLDRLKISSVCYWLLIDKITLGEVKHYIDDATILCLFHTLQPDDLRFFGEHFSSYIPYLAHTEEQIRPKAYAHATSHLKAEGKISTEDRSSLQPIIDHGLATEQDIRNLNETEYQTTREYLSWILYIQQPLARTLFRITQLQRLAPGKDLLVCAWLYALDKIALEPLAVLSREQLQLINNILQLFMVGLITYDQVFMILCSEGELLGEHFSDIQIAFSSLTSQDLHFMAKQIYSTLERPLNAHDLPVGITIEDLLAHQSSICTELLNQIIANIGKTSSSSAGEAINNDYIWVNPDSFEDNMMTGTPYAGNNSSLYTSHAGRSIPPLTIGLLNAEEEGKIPFEKEPEGKPFASSYHLIAHHFGYTPANPDMQDDPPPLEPITPPKIDTPTDKHRAESVQEKEDTLDSEYRSLLTRK